MTKYCLYSKKANVARVDIPICFRGEGLSIAYFRARVVSSGVWKGRPAPYLYGFPALNCTASLKERHKTILLFRMFCAMRSSIPIRVQSLQEPVLLNQVIPTMPFVIKYRLLRLLGKITANQERFLTDQAEHSTAPSPPQMLSAFRKLFSSPSTPVSAIAKEIASPIIREDPLDPHWGMLWRTLKAAVDYCTEDNDKFVELIAELQKLPDENHTLKHLRDFNRHWTEFADTRSVPASVITISSD